MKVRIERVKRITEHVDVEVDQATEALIREYQFLTDKHEKGLLKGGDALRKLGIFEQLLYRLNAAFSSEGYVVEGFV